MDTKEIKKVNLLEYVKSRMQSNEEYEGAVFEKKYSAILDVEIDALYRGMDVYAFNKADIIKIDGVLDPRKAGNGWIRKKPTIAKSFGRRHVYYWHFQESQHDRVYLSYYREINAYSAVRARICRDDHPDHCDGLDECDEELNNPLFIPREELYCELNEMPHNKLLAESERFIYYTTYLNEICMACKIEPKD